MVERVRHYDTGTLAKPVRRADGSVVVEARFTRTGVFKYRNPDGTERSEYRPPSAVFDSKSMDSFRLIPFTNNHPEEMLSAENAREHVVGSTGETVRRDGIWMVGTIAVFDAATIRDMDSGKTQISNGYDADLIHTPGISPEGEHYDCIQANIEGNHVALVHNARAGKNAAIRMDGAAMIDDTETAAEPHHKDNAMDLAQALAALAAANIETGKERARADKAEDNLKLAIKRVDTVEGERDAVKAAADKAEAARKDAVDGLDARVDARVELVTKALRILDSEDDESAIRKMPDRALKLAVIKQVTNADCDKDASGKARSMDYIDARFDAACDQAADSADTYREAHNTLEDSRQSNGSKSSKTDASTDKAYDEMVAANRNSWRKDGDPLKPTATK